MPTPQQKSPRAAVFVNFFPQFAQNLRLIFGKARRLNILAYLLRDDEYARTTPR